MEYIVAISEIVISESGIKPKGKNFFKGKVFNSSNYKIYILKLGNEYLYVGKTNRTIGARFGDGFRSYKKKTADETKAAYPYKWIKEYLNQNKNLKLYVFDLQPPCEDNHTEAIEAEIVFQIRLSTDKWPLCQNEIHFFNEFNDFKDAREVARKILKQIENEDYL